MSHSKLESLPNEILINLFENYINGVDIIVAFNYQLNQRFTSLISHVKRMSFDFSRCRKDDFRFCLGLLPAYVNKVEKLVLSDESTPGAIFAFFSFYPSFRVFRRLRILVLQYRADENNELLIERAIQSLISTKIETLSVIRNSEDEYSDPVSITQHTFCLPTLKHLRLHLPTLRSRTLPTLFDMPNLENLSLNVPDLNWLNLERLCQHAPQLKSLRMRLPRNYTHSIIQIYPMANTTMSRLHTLILSVNDCVSLTFEKLANYLRTTPMLRRLIINAHTRLILATEWQNLIEISLPLLEDFILWINRNDLLHPNELTEVYLDSFQTGFWIDHLNFHFIVVEHYARDWSNFNLFATHDMKYLAFDTKYIKKLTIAPKRKDQRDVSIVDKFNFLDLTSINWMDMSQYRLEQVESQLVDMKNFTLHDDSILPVDCSRIKSLSIACRHNTSKDIMSMLHLMKNLSKLVINTSFIYDISLPCPSIRSLYLFGLDISSDTDGIVQLGRCFPFLESLKIRWDSGIEFSKLGSCCPHLHCLELEKPIDLLELGWKNVEFDRRDTVIETSGSIRIWLDHNAIKAVSNITTFAEEQTQAISRRTTTKKNRIKEAISSLFRRFK